MITKYLTLLFFEKGKKHVTYKHLRFGGPIEIFGEN